jgi:hypothetical protein
MRSIIANKCKDFVLIFLLWLIFVYILTFSCKIFGMLEYILYLCKRKQETTTLIASI